MATGIKDKVAIIGMGCTKFGERWDMGAEELMVEAFEECIADAGIEKNDIGAAWLGTCFESINVGRSAMPLSLTLRLPFIPVTRVENFCATGTEAFRGAVYAVASGAYDICLALGVEKLKDTGYGGLPSFVGSDSGTLTWQWFPNITAPGSPLPSWPRPTGPSTGCVGPGYQAGHCPRVGQEPCQRGQEPQGASSQGRDQGAGHGLPHHRAPPGAFRLLRGQRRGGLRHRHHAGDRQKSLGKKDLVSVKALQLALSSGEEMGFNDWDGDHFMTTSKASTMAYQEAGITDPRKEISA
jgi:acetyl-CoA C-acetyltransferase